MGGFTVGSLFCGTGGATLTFTWLVTVPPRPSETLTFSVNVVVVVTVGEVQVALAEEPLAKVPAGLVGVCVQAYVSVSPSGSVAPTESCTGPEPVIEVGLAWAACEIVGLRFTGARTVTCAVPLTEPPLPSVTVTRSWKDVSTVTAGAVHEGFATEVLLKAPAGLEGVCDQE